MFAEPDFEPARLLQADAFEQMGYQAESGPWRDSYLTGALELRTGMKGLGRLGDRAISGQLDVDMLVELIGVRLRAEALEGERVEINWHFTDVDEHHAIGLDNCAIHHRPDTTLEAADASVSSSKVQLASVIKGELDVDGFLEADGVTVDVDEPVRTLLGNLDQFSGQFGIVEP